MTRASAPARFALKDEGPAGLVLRPLGRVIGIDREPEADGTWSPCAPGELGRGSVIMGDRVRLTGDSVWAPPTRSRANASVLRRPRGAPDQRGRRRSSRERGHDIVVALADPLPQSA